MVRFGMNCVFNFVSSGFFLILLNTISVSNASRAGNESDSLTNVCKIPNLKPWIYFQYDVCIHLVVNESHYPSNCITKLVDTLTDNGIVIYQKSLSHMKNRCVSNQLKTNCESYLFVMENPQEWFHELSHQMNKSRKTFYPFSRLYFLSLHAKDIRPFGNVTTYFYRNALFGYKFMYDSIAEVESIQDFVLNSTMISSPNYTDLSHPMLDTNNRSHEFKVSVFNCPPHIIYLDKNGSRKDGLEYRFLTHVLKNWKIHYLHQNESMIPYDPFASMISQLSNGHSDMVMCGIWLNPRHSKRDLTSYFDHNCNTWIAPKPHKLDPTALVYLALSAPVWAAYIFCFILTVILLTLISKIEEHIKKTKIISSHFGRSFLEAANTATSHGIMNFPQQISVQILLVSWILLNLLVGLGYTTIYTSRLTSPGYTQPIDTFEDFADQGISWVSRHAYETVLETLNTSTRPAFHNIHKNFVFENSEEQLAKRLRTGRYGLFMSIRSMKYPVDIERVVHPSAEGIWNLFRFLKVCFLRHFSTFALTKHSPYTALFNAHIKRYQECGLIKKWYTDIYKVSKSMDTLFEAHPKHDNEPDALTMWDMKGAFFVLLTGLFISILAYWFEMTYVELKKIVMANKDKER